MTNKHLIIVGGVAGGASAAARARRLCEDWEIIMFERGPHVSFANCGLPYFVGGEIAEQDSLLVQTPESLKARFNLAPYGSAKDPVNLGGMAAQNVLDDYVALAQWNEVASLDPKTMLLLDLRRPDERARGFIPDSINIPLDELRLRLNELPRDREIITYCQSGQRSYNAARMLSQHGFRVRNLTGSYRTWKTATVHF